MKRGGELKRKTPLRTKAVPARTKPYDPDHPEVEKDAKAHVLHRDNYRCQFPAAAPRICEGLLHVHHVKRRSQGGTWAYANLIVLCGRHHDWVHNNPDKANELGLLKRSWEPQDK